MAAYNEKYTMKETIFLVINSFYGGGAEHAAARLSKEWDKRYKLINISFQPANADDYDFYGERRYITSNSKIWINRIKDYARQIDELACKYQPISIISFLNNPNLALCMSKYQCTKIISIRNYLPRMYSGVKLFLWRYLIKKYFRRADYVVSVSRLLSQTMHSEYGIDKKKCITIYNPYDIEEIRDKKKDSLDSISDLFYKKHVVISNVAHLCVAKGQYHLIRIMRELKKSYPNIGLVLVGKDKGYGERLMDLARKCNVEENVLFAGHQNNPYKFIENSRCFVLPSLWEGFPNALAEAMICGKPVIAFDCKSGPSEILKDSVKSYGVLLTDDTTEWLDEKAPLSNSEIKLIEVLKRIFSEEDYEKALSNAAFQRSLDFAMPNIVNQWYKLIEKNEV